MDKFTNIADFIINMCQNPKTIREDLTTADLYTSYDNTLRGQVDQQVMQHVEKYQGFQARFTEYEKRTRSVSKAKMFCALFKRSIVYLLRNPRTFQATIFNSFFLSIIFGSLLWNVGSNYSDIYYEQTEDLTRNPSPREQQALKFYLGASTMLMNNIYNWAAIGCILQLPLWVPVLKRELMNRMYTPGIYFLTRTISGTLFQMAYPTILTLIIFWLLGIKIYAANFFFFLLGAYGIVLCGCGMGYFFGSLFDFPQAANMFLSLALQYTYLISGGFANPDTMIGFNKYLAYASPCRYVNEIFFRVFADSASSDPIRS